MRVRICNRCGREFTLPPGVKHRLYCSEVCRTSGRFANRVEIDRCKYNHYVNCIGGLCEKCGWNPEVAEKRRAEIMARMMGEAENAETT